MVGLIHRISAPSRRRFGDTLLTGIFEAAFLGGWFGQEATRCSLGTGQLAQKGKANLKDVLKLTIR